MKKKIARKLRIKGLVQSVGFRPFIYRHASKHGLCGWVENRNDAVIVKIEGIEQGIGAFVSELTAKAPPASRIESVEIENDLLEHLSAFTINPSKNVSNRITEISPDIAVCKECLKDMQEQDHRLDYPFINCVNCGPRFTIIKELPYDRDKTTMDKFEMCSQCESEYKDMHDRRFHAQPVACNHCGPAYRLLYNNVCIDDWQMIVSTTAQILDKGGIVAWKGIGGYNLVCDAFSEFAVEKMRRIKKRDSKPFALMFDGIDKLKEVARINDEEKQALCSWRRPIVLLEKKQTLISGIADGLSRIGVMLPYMPIHYQLFRVLKTQAIVYTSGNFSGEPIVINNAEAEKIFLGFVDAILMYNRDIYNRCDDSVGFVANEQFRLMRRSRGFVPAGIGVPVNVEGILAAGAELKNCFCIGKDNTAFMSQHIGDLKSLEAMDFYEESVEHFSKVYKFRPELAAVDMHDDYMPTKFAEEMDLPLVRVQHHHAHIASCMVEHGLDEDVIGVSFDGTGLGTDGHIWGGEFLICSLSDFRRDNHFEYFPMPGGDKAAQEPWRMALSCLHKFMGGKALDITLELFKDVKSSEQDLVLKMLNRQLNCPKTSSAGRIFDAVSALAGVCTHSTYEGEAPMKLESVIEPGTSDKYRYDLGCEISLSRMFEDILSDLRQGIGAGIISARFHNTMVLIIVETVDLLKEKYNLNKVVLSGGVFQNKYLLENCEIQLRQKGYEVYSNQLVPVNDGGVALGQIAIAAKRREMGCV